MKLKILTLNLQHGGRLMDDILNFLKTENADILCMQEVYDGTIPSLERRLRSMETLKEHLNYSSHFFTPAFIDRTREGNVPGGNAVLARFPGRALSTSFFNEPLTERDPYLPETPESIGQIPRILQHVSLDTPAGQINVFNVHGVWDLDGDNYSDRRREMSQKIISAVSGRQNVILAGDTNAQPTNRAIKDIENHLTSVFGTELKSTFNMKRKTNPGYATARVDMIFVSPSIRVLEKQCHEVDVSDHLPLSATLEIA
jgi:endonuclease/exonuclease/phosphatase family metal-dependent hydrolase